MTHLLRRVTRASASFAAAGAASGTVAAGMRVRDFHSGVPSSHVLNHGHSHGSAAPFVPKVARDGGSHLGVGRSTAVIAIGSNQGDRVDLFRQALRALKGAGIEGAPPLLHWDRVGMIVLVARSLALSVVCVHTAVHPPITCRNMRIPTHRSRRTGRPSLRVPRYREHGAGK